jgi:uridine kinase
MERLKLNSVVLTFGLLVRFLLVLTITPKLQTQFYIPFLASIDGNLDPWHKWLTSGGAQEAFPYGLSMLLVHLPQIALYGTLMLFGFESLYVLTLASLVLVLLSELLIFRIMYLRNVPILIIGFFFLNPLFIYLNYIQGANDILPAALLVLSAHLLCNKKSRSAGLFLGLAIGMKYSLALTLPFFALYSFDNPRSRNQINLFSRYLLPAAIACYSPLIFSESFRTMIFSSLEASSLLRFGILIGNFEIAVFPIVYIFLLYWLWKAGRTSIETLLIFAGTSFIAISIANPTTPGWLLWGFPLIMLLMQPASASFIALKSIFLFSYSIFILSNNIKVDSEQLLFNQMQTISNASFTLTTGFGAVLVISALRQSLDIGDVYSFGKNPLVISIAGDSGVGKDTLSSVLRDLFGPKQAIEICGDDFHRFERRHPIWQNTTHLDPFANNLKLWEKNLRLARNRQPFKQEIYDHKLGIFSESTIKPKADLVISQGLHALYPSFDALSDLKIYISMDEELRVSNKISRDVAQRGKTPDQVVDSIISRAEDSSSFIKPQRDNADLLIDISGEQCSETEIRFSSRNPSFAGKLFEILELFEVPDKNFSIDDSGRQTVGIVTNQFSGSTALQVLESSLMSFNQMFECRPDIPDGHQGVLGMVVFLAIDWEKSQK